MLRLFGLAIFTSAFLLFSAQPLLGRLVLPLLGGTPAVWNTSLLFFQTLLLAGYLYAHLLSTRLRVETQVGIHALTMAAGLLVLPVGLQGGGEPPAGTWPVAWLLQRLALSIGAPFFALSATGPLFQRWFAGTDAPKARDPYFLYAASNAGSLLALVGYPFLESHAGLVQQGRLWAVGYVAFLLLGVACGLARVRRPAPVGAVAGPAVVPLSGTRRARWMFLAFVPSALLFGVTLYITTDIASVPLLWILPLSTYLLTFILAFAERALVTTRAAARLYPIVALALAATWLFHVERPVAVILALHLAALFLGAMLGHGRLAAERPHPQQLTEFYLWIASGGVLGGVFCALIAPRLFATVLEYPIALVFAFLLLPAAERALPSLRSWAIDAGLAVATVGAFVGLAHLLRAAGPALAAAHPALPVVLEVAVTALPLVMAVLAMRRRERFLLAYAAIVIVVQARLGSAERLLHLERTFFGVHRVTADRDETWHRLSHGTTRHGLQLADAKLRSRPMMYYHPTGPLGDVFRVFLDDPAFQRVGVIGLGAGTIAAYAQAGRHFTFFEIDAAVARIAENPAYFTYLRDARAGGATVDVVLGDARLTLRAVPDATFDLLVSDAFSSDAVPLHLITKEALGLYMQKVKPGGLLAFHVSNGYLDLRPPLGAVARDLHLWSYYCRDQRPPGGWPASYGGKDSSTWVLIARRDADLRTIPRAPSDERWVPYAPEASFPAWTDDYANVLSVLD